MTQTNEVNIKDHINKAKNILIICKNNANDSLATGISLAKYIEKTEEKSPMVIYQGNMASVDPYLLSLYHVRENIEPRKLKLTLNYSGSNIETLNWQKDEANGNIVFEIMPIEKNFDMSRISHSFYGGEYDLIITVGVQSLADMGDLYIKNKDIFESAPIINIDKSRENTKFGAINIIDTQVESLSGLMFSKFAEWKYVPDKDVVKSLLVGINGS